MIEMPLRVPTLRCLRSDYHTAYTVVDLNLPQWFTKRHAHLVYQDKELQKSIVNHANYFLLEIDPSMEKWAKKFQMIECLFCGCCGMSFVHYRVGDATSLGIDSHNWHEGYPENRIRDHNIDNLQQLVVLYNVWAFYFTALEMKREAWDASTTSTETKSEPLP